MKMVLAHLCEVVRCQRADSKFKSNSPFGTRNRVVSVQRNCSVSLLEGAGEPTISPRPFRDLPDLLGALFFRFNPESKVAGEQGQQCAHGELKILLRAGALWCNPKSRRTAKRAARGCPKSVRTSNPLKHRTFRVAEDASDPASAGCVHRSPTRGSIRGEGRQWVGHRPTRTSGAERASGAEL